MSLAQFQKKVAVESDLSFVGQTVVFPPSLQSLLLPGSNLSPNINIVNTCHCLAHPCPQASQSLCSSDIQSFWKIHPYQYQVRLVGFRWG